MVDAFLYIGSEVGHLLKVAFFAFGSIGLIYIIGMLLFDMYETSSELFDDEDED